MNKNTCLLMIVIILITLLSVESKNKKMPKIEKKRNKAQSSVLTLNETNYEAALRENSHVFIAFETVDCKLCKYLNSQLKKLSIEVKTKNWDIKVARIDGIQNPSLAELYKIPKDGYPSIFLVNKKENATTEYHGDHSMKSMLSYLNYRMTYSVKEINSLSEINDHIRKRQHCLLFVGDRNQHWDNYNTITKNYDELRSFTVLHTRSQAIMQHFNVAPDSYDVVLFTVLGVDHHEDHYDEKKGKDKSKELKMNITLDNGVKFNMPKYSNLNKETFLHVLNSFLRPLIGHLSDESLNSVFEEKVTALVLIGKSEKEMITLAEKTAPKYRPDIWFIVGTIKDEGSRMFMKTFKIKKDSLPAMIILHPERNLVDDLHKFKYIPENKKIDENDIETFIANWRANRVKRFWVSEDAPKKPVSKSGLHRIVSDTLFKYLSNSTQDLVLLFCSHYSQKCNRLELAYELVAMKLKNNTNLVIGEIDPIANEFEGIDLKHIPHLVYIPGGSDPESRLKEPHVYSGNYTIAELVDFVKTHYKQGELHVASMGKREEKFLKYEKSKPVIKEGEEDYDIHYYAKYGKQRFVGDYENENDEEMNVEGMDDEGHPEDDHEEDYDRKKRRRSKKKSKKSKKEYKNDL